MRPGSTCARHGDRDQNRPVTAHFWVGIERRKISVRHHRRRADVRRASGRPPQVRHPYPVVLVHGGSGQMLHYMGLGRWRRRVGRITILQAGYRVFLVDRPGHGRAPYHPDALGPIGRAAQLRNDHVPDFRRSANGPNKRWPGTGEIGDPGVDQFMASQNAAPQDNVMAHKLWASGGAELLDQHRARHRAGAFGGWTV